MTESCWKTKDEAFSRKWDSHSIAYYFVLMCINVLVFLFGTWLTLYFFCVYLSSVAPLTASVERRPEGQLEKKDWTLDWTLDWSWGRGGGAGG